jgi:hypothetical protein
MTPTPPIASAHACDHGRQPGLSSRSGRGRPAVCCDARTVRTERHVRDQNRLDAIDQRGELTPELDGNSGCRGLPGITRTFCEGDG